MAALNKQNETIAETINVLRLKFPGVAQSFDAVVWPCLNPECTCNNATVRFCQPDTNLDTIHFQLTVNLDTFELISTQLNDSENDYPKIIYEFMSKLTDDDKKWILKGNKEAREIANSNHANSNPHSFKSGAMAWYRDIFNTESKYHEWTLYVDTKRYFVADEYCINPDCDCRNVLIFVHEYKKGKMDREPAIVYTIDFDSDNVTIEESQKKLTRKQESNIIYGVNRLCGCNQKKLFEHRYHEIKRWADIHRDLILEDTEPTETFAWQEALMPTFNNDNNLSSKPNQASPEGPTAKVGRNDPCPCGSGKKYKKCCGQAG